MTRRGRLGRVAAAVHAGLVAPASDAAVHAGLVAPASDAAVHAGLVAPASDAAWVAALDAAAADPGYTFGPDYARAVAAFRPALAADPLGSPPAWFEPGLDPADRFGAWCRAHPRPAVEVARAWAAELLLRVVNGTPPVTAAEFEELAAWARANETRLRG